MLKLVIENKEYKVKFGYNSFCDSDLMDRTEQLLDMISVNQVDEKARFSGELIKTFECVRELLFIGFKKYNPVESVEEVGDLLDTYRDECPEGESRGIFDIFAMLANELLTEGFFGDVMNKTEKIMEATAKKKAKKN